MHNIKLPKSGIEVTFRAPKIRERREMLKTYPGAKEIGFAAEEILLAKCLVSINNKNVEDIPNLPGGDEYDYLEVLDIYDFQYLVDVFATMFFIDEEGRKKAADEGKRLMGHSGTATNSTKQPSTGK